LKFYAIYLERGTRIVSAFWAIRVNLISPLETSKKPGCSLVSDIGTGRRTSAMGKRKFEGLSNCDVTREYIAVLWFSAFERGS